MHDFVLTPLGSSPTGPGATAQHFVELACNNAADRESFVRVVTEMFPFISAAWLDGSPFATLSFPTRSLRHRFLSICEAHHA